MDYYLQISSQPVKEEGTGNTKRQVFDKAMYDKIFESAMLERVKTTGEKYKKSEKKVLANQTVFNMAGVQAIQLNDKEFNTLENMASAKKRVIYMQKIIKRHKKIK